MSALHTPVDKVMAMLLDSLDLHCCHFEPFPFDVQLPRIEPGRIMLPAAEPGVLPCPLDNRIELPVRSSGLLLGRFVLVPRVPTVGVALDLRAREEAMRLADAFGADLARSWGVARIA